MDEPSLPLDDREGAYELLQRGQSLMRKRHHAQAAIVLARAARLEPGKGSILEALGRAQFNAAQPELARETFEHLLEVDPSSPYAHFALGQSLKRLGRNREARTHLKMAVALDPMSPLYRGALARLGPGPTAMPGQAKPAALTASGTAGDSASGATGDSAPAAEPAPDRAAEPAPDPAAEPAPDPAAEPEDRPPD
ncbi:MAG: tetratricopeptide repeat protein [Chloroflexi bacterium]|nr:tetratricopeptide repeat protein [Chloroflexota bacterium]